MNESQPWRRGSRALLLWVLLSALATPATGRLLRTGQTPLEHWNPIASLTIGSSVEYERDKEQSQFEFPFFVEYNLTPALKATIEPAVVHVAPRKEKEPTATGLGDLETALDYEFVRERRYRPALTAEGVVRWPTASNSDLGDPGHDYSIGLIASKDLVFVDLDLRFLYTFLADQRSQDVFEISLAGQWHINYRFDLEAEVVQSFGGAGSNPLFGSGSAGVISRAAANLTEATVGLAWHVNKRLKLEEGAVYTSDGSWRFVAAWEFSFGGE